MNGRGVTERLARASAARPRRTLAVWGIVVVAAFALIATSLHGLTSDAHVTGNPESARAASAIAKAFPPTPQSQATDVVVVSSTRYTASDPTFRALVAGLVRDIQATGKIAGVASYLDGIPQLVAPSRHATLIQLVAKSDDAMKPVIPVVQRAGKTPNFTVGVTGDHTVGHDFGTLSQRDLEHGELAFGLPAALIVLVLVFGAVTGALVPVLMAIISILVGLGIVALLSLEFSLSIFIVNMLTGMGLALGIDYSLFVVSRYREERTHGLAKQEAIGMTGATASRAVLFSGSTFVVALFGMLLVPTTIMRSLAAGAIIVGVVSVVAALTLLPALLGLLGDRVNSLRVPFVGRNLGQADTGESRFWGRIVDAVQRHPTVSLVVTAGALIALAVPTLGIHIGASGVETLPSDMPSRQGFALLQREFPAQSPSPAQVVVQGGNGSVQAQLVALERRLASDPRFGPGQIAVSGDTRLLSVPVRGDERSSLAVSAVRDLRKHLAPAALAGTGATVLIGGKTAENADYFDAVTNPTPYVLLFVLGLSFVVLTIAFRSLVVALLSILLNLLSVGAAYGLLTLVFLHGYGHSWLGFQHVHAVDAWVPLFLFSVLFGLSMDYQVFLMSRIKERYDQSGSTRDAVRWGITSTAKIITGAALIIVVVFTGFAMGQLVMFQQMGFGVAVALLLDATLIRSVVLPASLTLLDRWSWYLPRWLDWLPHLEVERPAPASQGA
jgi:RND superfamily putative drug exporter